MTELTLADHVTVPEAVVSRELDGETIVLNLETGIYFGLDMVATDIWKALRMGGSLQDALENVMGLYDVDASVVREDLLQLVNQLATKGLVRAADSPTAG